MRVTSTVFIPATILVGLLLWSYWLAQDAPGRALSFALLSGAAFGVILQRGRFCFLCNFRDFADRRDPDGILAILVALAVGIVLYLAVMGAWVPVPQPQRLPPGAHIGPVGIVLIVSALVFGLGMAISGSCLSGHLYRLGEGAFGSLAALLGAAIGFLIAFSTWNTLYTTTVFDDPSVWLPHHLGYTGATVGALAVISLLAVAAFKFAVPVARPVQSEQGPAPLTNLADSIFRRRWSPVVTGTLIAILSAISFLRVAPIGVTAELGSLVRTAAVPFGLVPETLVGLDTLRGCISTLKTTILSPNGVFVIGLVLASFASALSAEQFRPSWPAFGGVVARFFGGVLMGWGAMTGFGCTVGVLLSGIHAGALSGWVFLVFCSLGAFAGLKLMRRATP